MSINKRLVSELKELASGTLSRLATDISIDHEHLVVRVDKSKLTELMLEIRNNPNLSFDMLLSVTVVDWMDKAESRFEVVYHALSLKNFWRIRVKVWVPEHKPEVDSVTSIWSSALFMEREAWDMFGVKFVGHPDLRRVLMYEEFKGHPLRKDYPLQGKQPRVKLRAPEVENTARNMYRPELVSIRNKGHKRVSV